MSERLSQFVSRHAVVVILAWLVLAVGLKGIAPRWNDVTHDGDLEFLPREMPSVRGAELLNEAFAGVGAKSQMVVVLARADQPLEPNDFALAHQLAAAFSQEQAAGHLPIVAVWNFETQVVGRMLVSRDRHATLVVLQLSNDLMATDNIRVLNAVRATAAARLAEADPALKFGVTGSAAIGGDLLQAASESIQNTELTTIVLVIVILLIVYRAPLLVLVPLVTIGVSLSVSVDLITLATQLGALPGMEWWSYKIFKTTKIFVIVVLFGAGTDFCLFLIARYREELQTGYAIPLAAARALHAVSGALTASALTTILGLATMFFADFSKFSYSGPTIALALAVTLVACLTLAPALLVSLKRWVFWPRHRLDHLDSLAEPEWIVAFWERLGSIILARPALILGLALVGMAPLAYAGASVNITYDLLSELRPHRPSVVGTNLLWRYFAPGETGPLTILAYREQGEFDAKEGEYEIARLTKFLFEIPGVASVRSLAEPTGDPPGKTQLFSTRSLAKLAAKQHPTTKARFVATNPQLAGKVARFDVILDYDPFSLEARETLDVIERQLVELRRQHPEWRETRFEYAGVTAGIRDLERVTKSDRNLIQQLVVIAVLAVLLVILRRPVICLYLILSVLWSYFVTIGLTEEFFAWSYGDSFHGLDWKVPIFLFVILVAVGQDYNIYLVTRVFEEQERRGLFPGLRRALVRTGGIITSCGVIMAGAFISMMTGTLRGMVELGFALSLGILLDTLVIRTILVPAFLALVAKYQLRGAERG